jgi:hypothetical protein
MPPDPGEGVNDGVVEDGRVHPAPVLVEDDGNFASLASTRREWAVGGGSGDLTESFIGKVKFGQEDSTAPNVLAVLTILEDVDDEGI